MSHELRSALLALGYAYLTSLPVVLGASFGTQLLDAPRFARSPARSVVGLSAYGVGHRYADIATHGYALDDYAFFPLFPLLGRGIRLLTGARSSVALLVVAYLSLAAAFIALRAYVRTRFPDDAELNRDYVLLAFGLWPATFFFRLAYPEPLFILFAVVTLLALELRWPIAASALIAGLASATRPVGVALVLPVALSAWRAGGTLPCRATRSLFAIVLACWGLIGYMGCQYCQCGNAFEFVRAQSYFRVRPQISPPKRALALATCEPIRGFYEPSSSIYWRYRERHRVALFSYLAANVPLFLIVAGGVAMGWRRGWLTANELALSVGLLAIPYLTRAYEMGMSGMGRFAAVAFPFYLVAGKTLASMPRPLAAALLGIAAVFLSVYSSFVAAGFNLG